MTPPTSTDTRWVPYFAPDEPDSGGYTNSYINYSTCGGNHQPNCTTTIRNADQRNASHYNGASPQALALRISIACRSKFSR